MSDRPTPQAIIEQLDRIVKLEIKDIAAELNDLGNTCVALLETLSKDPIWFNESEFTKPVRQSAVIAHRFHNIAAQYQSITLLLSLIEDTEDTPHAS